MRINSVNGASLSPPRNFDRAARSSHRRRYDHHENSPPARSDIRILCPGNHGHPNRSRKPNRPMPYWQRHWKQRRRTDGRSLHHCARSVKQLRRLSLLTLRHKALIYMYGMEIKRSADSDPAQLVNLPAKSFTCCLLTERQPSVPVYTLDVNFLPAGKPADLVERAL